LPKFYYSFSKDKEVKAGKRESKGREGIKIYKLSLG